MLKRAFITVIERALTLHLVLDQGGDPLSVGHAFLATAAPSAAQRRPGEWAAAFVLALGSGHSRTKTDRPMRIVADPTEADGYGFRYAISVDGGTLQISVKEIGEGPPKAEPQGKILFTGDLAGYAAAFKISTAAPDQTYLVEVVSVEKDVYHRVFTAPSSGAERLRAIIAALAKAKDLRAGKVLPLREYVPEFTVDDLVEQLTDLCGDMALRRATSSLSANIGKGKKKG